MANRTVDDLVKRVQASAQMHQRTYTPQEGEKELIQVPLDKIDPNPYQPRTNFDQQDLERLAATIKADGLMQPITVRRSASGGGRYEIVCGERRYRAHKLLGEHSIECLLVTVDDKKIAAMALAENIAREDLSDYEVAKGIKAIEKNFGSRTELADEIGINRQDMYRYLAYFNLPAQLIAALEAKPSLFGRSACYAIKSALEKFDDNPRLEDVLTNLIELLSEKKIDQAAAAPYLTRELSSQAPQPEKPKEAIKEAIGAGKKKLGEFKTTETEFTVRLKRKQLNADQERRLMEFIASLTA